MMPYGEGFCLASGPAASGFNMVQSPVYGDFVQSPMYGASPMYTMRQPFCQDTMRQSFCQNAMSQPFCRDAVYQPLCPDEMHGMGYPLLPNPGCPFTLCFIMGNITTCIGCKNKYRKPAEAPYDLCIRHEEWRQFISPSTSTPQSKFGNAYYHCKFECVWIPNFLSSDLQVPPDLIGKLSMVHKQHLLSVFGLNL